MKISPVKIKRKILRNIKKVPERVRQEARRRFNVAKREMIDEFENHPVTREIEGGPAASNSSGTLGGEGNLFSFIGFYEGTSPIDVLRELLQSYEINTFRPTIRKRASGIDYRFRITGPSIEQIEAATYLNWLGKSWIRGVERGMSGLGNYLAVMGAMSSRSGGGLQIKRVRGSAHKPTRYVSSMLRTFFLRFR